MTGLTALGLDELMARARAVRDAHYGRRVTYSPKVFIPLTFLCNDGLVLPVHLLPKNYLTSRKVMVCSLKREMAAHLTPIGMLLMTSQSSGVYHWVHRE